MRRSFLGLALAFATSNSACQDSGAESGDGDAEQGGAGQAAEAGFGGTGAGALGGAGRATSAGSGGASIGGVGGAEALDAGGAGRRADAGGSAGRPNDAGAGGASSGAGGSSHGSGGGAGSANGGAGRGGAAAGAGAGGAASELTAFPGAQGFGRFAVGGRGRDVVHVTNLEDSGPGSLREAISQPYRTVVFDVGGVIRLESRLVFKNNQTIAGQTAPGGGITLYGDGTSFSGANHTIVRYVRFRMGKIGESEKDTVTMAHGHDVIWDHCSLSWGRDGTFDLNQESGETLFNLTLQDSIVAQGLQTHSTGGLVNTTGTSILRSLYIDNNSRNPKARGTLQFVNNVIYNWVVSGYILGDTSGRSDGYMVGNYLITGPETRGGTLDSPTAAYRLFASGNYYDSNRNGSLDGRLLGQADFGSVTWETAPSADFPAVPELEAAEAFAYVSERAGASLFRDAVDDYVVNELSSLGTAGATISDETSLGLPGVVGAVPSGPTPEDTDQDGMPDAWETANALDPNNAMDRNDDRNGDGWTNLEEYVNSLVP